MMASNGLALRLDPAPLIIRFLASHLSPSRFAPRITSRFNALPLHSSGMLKCSDIAVPSAALPFHPHSLLHHTPIESQTESAVS